MNTYTNQELKKFFEIFTNLKPLVKNIVDINNKVLNELEKEYKGKPYIDKKFFERYQNYMPFDFEEFSIESDDENILIVETESLWGGCDQVDYHNHYIPFKWLYSENPELLIKDHYLEDIKYMESEYNIAVEKAKERKAIEEAAKIKREKEQYELLKAKFEGEK